MTNIYFSFWRYHMRFTNYWQGFWFLTHKEGIVTKQYRYIGIGMGYFAFYASDVKKYGIWRKK